MRERTKVLVNMFVALGATGAALIFMVWTSFTSSMRHPWLSVWCLACNTVASWLVVRSSIRMLKIIDAAEKEPHREN